MIHDTTTSRGAGFVRSWIFSIWVLYVAGNMTHAMAVFPRSQFQPVGLLRILPDSFYDVLLTSAGLRTLDLVLIAGLAACALGVRPWRLVAIPTVLLLTLQQGIPRGLFDYMNHNELSALYATYVFAMFPATGFSVFGSARTKAESSADDVTSRFLMVLATSVFVVPYSLIALRRLGWSDWSIWSSDLLPSYIAQYSFGDSWYGVGAVGQTVLGSPWILRALTISFPIVTVLELLAPLCLLHRRFRYVWVVVVAGFHISTLLLMDIFFWQSLMLLPVLLLDGDVMLRWFDKLTNRRDKHDSLHGHASVEPNAALR